MPSAICLAILIRACWKKRKKRGYREAKKRSLSGEGTRGESAQFRKASEAKKKEEEERNRKGKKSERLNKLTSPTWIAAAKTPASGSRASGEEEGGSCCCCWCVEVEVEVEERRRGYEKQASTGPIGKCHLESPPLPFRFSPGESLAFPFSGRAIDALALVPCRRPSTKGRNK
jgi:hypothetical protein